jgi:hypothetical protein
MRSREGGDVTTRYWIIDERRTDPVRRREGGAFESFVGGEWGAHASLIWITMRADSGDAVWLGDPEEE